MENNGRVEQLLNEASVNLAKALEEIRRAKISDASKTEIEKQIFDEFRHKTGREILDSARAKIIEKKTEESLEAPGKDEWHLRFCLFFRIQHMILFTSVILLVLTGLPLKFTESSYAKLIFATHESFIVASVVHRIAASLLMLFIVLHLYYVLFTRDGRSDFMRLLPRPKDALDIFDNFKYFFGSSKRPARFDRFSYIEKFDYWAVYWGVIVMIGTGAGLWFQEQFLAFLPKYLLDVLKEMHSDEALLATLAIVIWHFYNVHFNPSRFPGTLLWWHGKISAEEMKEEHPLEYERIMKKRAEDEAKEVCEPDEHRHSHERDESL